MKNHKAATIFIILILSSLLGYSFSVAQSLNPDEQDERERRHFDFLIGEWKIVEKTTAEGTVLEGDDVYTFKEALDGNAIISEWYFNRGTVSNLNYTEGLYYTAYDNLTNTWSFYYISKASAQYYQGKKENGRWYFYKEFTIEGNTFLQRQSWRLQDDLTVIRSIENSLDNGKTWNEVYVVKLTKRRK